MAETYTVQQGDTLASIAFARGFLRWQTIWEHAQNAGLREQRKDPHVLYPGDSVFIPDKTIKKFDCATKKLHTFRLKKPRLHFEQLLIDDEDQPYASKPFKLVAGGETIEGRTDGDGRVSEEIPFDAREVELTVWPVEGDDSSALTWTLDLGHLDPIDTVEGVQARLSNLGYACKVTGSLDDETKDALRAYQGDQGLQVTGEIDESTKSRLAQHHD
ncbi:MAG: peptidoglycan-binding protein [Planctomycetes bacterium]|nr:peptidoglycan-binding protein [Planctomycetota bacterium]